MAEQLIIEFKTDLKGIKEGETALENLAKKDEKLAESTKKNSIAIKDRNKLLKEQSQATNEATGSLEKLNEEMNQMGDNVKTKEAGKGMKELATSISDAAAKGQSLKGVLTKLKAELSLLEEQGKSGTKEFRNLAIQAGRVEDQMGDTAQRVRILASDTKNLDAAMSVATGLAGTFSVAQGIVGAFGAENEELQKTMLKVQSALAIVNGLQAVSNTLNKDSAARVVLQAKAQDLYALAVGRSTGALKIFRLALISTGIGAIIVLLGALVANFDKVKAKVIEMFPVLGKLGDIWDVVKQKVMGFVNATVEAVTKVGKILVNFFTGDLAGVVKEAKTFGADVAKAFNEGVKEEMLAQANEREKLLLESQLKTQARQLSLLEAGGKDTYELKKKMLTSELRLIELELGKQSEEYKDKYTEIQALTIAHNKELVKLARERNTDMALLTEDEAKTRAREELVELVLRIQEADEIVLKKLEERQNKEKPFIERFIQWEKQRRLDVAKETFLEIVSLAQVGYGTLTNIADAAMNFELASLQKQLKEKKISQEEYERQVAIQKRKSAIAQKGFASFEAAINAAAAVVEALPNLGLAAIVGASGAALVLKILSEPIPQFAKGTKKAPKGMKLVGEKGAELLYDNGGYGILPADITKMILDRHNNVNLSSAANNKVYNNPSYTGGSVSIDYKVLAKEIGKEFSSSIEQLPVSENTWDERGYNKTVRKGLTREEYVNKRYGI